MGAFSEDVEDIQTVTEYLARELGYVIDIVIGHSKGSVAGMRWASTSPQASSLRGFVNISGRYRMEASLKFGNLTVAEQFFYSSRLVSLFKINRLVILTGCSKITRILINPSSRRMDIMTGK